MKRTLSYTITNKNKADTIGAFLRDAGYSRRILIELKQNPEQICLNGTPSWLNTPLQTRDTMKIRWQTPSRTVLPRAANISYSVP